MNRKYEIEREYTGKMYGEEVVCGIPKSYISLIDRRVRVVESGFIEIHLLLVKWHDLTRADTVDPLTQLSRARILNWADGWCDIKRRFLRIFALDTLANTFLENSGSAPITSV
jgi:hypothetical protein